jgi:hypothetical protein
LIAVVVYSVGAHFDCNGVHGRIAVVTVEGARKAVTIEIGSSIGGIESRKRKLKVG